jgi:hypothetical protein
MAIPCSAPSAANSGNTRIEFSRYGEKSAGGESIGPPPNFESVAGRRFVLVDGDPLLIKPPVPLRCRTSAGDLQRVENDGPRCNMQWM